MRMWKKVTLGAAVFIVAVPVLFLAYLFEGGFDQASPPDDADLLLPDPEPVPDDENAYVAILSLTNLWTLSDILPQTNSVYISERNLVYFYAFQVEGDSNREWEYGFFKTNRTVMTEYADQILAANERLFGAFPDSIRKKQYQPLASDDPITNESWVATLRNLERVFLVTPTLYSLRIQRAIEKDDFQSAMADCEMLFSLGWHFDAAAWKSKCRFYAMRKMTHLAWAEGIPDAIFDRIEEGIADSEPQRTDFDQAVRETYSADRKLLTKLTRSHLIYHLSESHCHPWIVACFDWPVGFRFAFHPNETLAQMTDWSHKMLRGEFVRLPDETHWFHFNHTVFCFLTPNWYGKSIAWAYHHNELRYGAFLDCQLACRACRLSLAAAKWRKANGGGFPPTLEALVPAYIDAIPADPYDPSHPLRYHPETGVVWSVGDEGTFDYGKTIESGGRSAEDRRKRERFTYRLDGKVKW